MASVNHRVPNHVNSVVPSPNLAPRTLVKFGLWNDVWWCHNKAADDPNKLRGIFYKPLQRLFAK